MTDFAAVRPNYAGVLRRPPRIPSAMRPVALVLAFAAMTTSLPAQRARARDLGVAPGVLSPGANNAITDVTGVRVGHTTVTEGAGIRTGVTAVL
ncbi:MAG: P1 family peptidase, partial [Gemmatimonadaceae bacterium]